MTLPSPVVVRIVQDGFPWSAFWAGVQALGSLAALGLAVWLPRLQEHRDRARFRETALGYAQMVTDAVSALATYAGDFSTVTYKLPLQQVSIELKLPMIIAAAERMPLERLHSREATTTFTKLLGAAQTYQNELALGRGFASQNEDLVNGKTTRRYAAERVITLNGDLKRLLSSSAPQSIDPERAYARILAAP